MTNGIFHAYISTIVNPSYGRIVLTFATRSVADEWWRAISDLNNGLTALLSNVERVTPQFYIYNSGVFDIYSFFDDARTKDVANKFRGKMFLTRENDSGGRGFDLIASQNIVDHISGRRFYIRSLSNPNVYWYYDARARTIKASSTGKATQFSIFASNVPNDTVMIATDSIHIRIDERTYVGVDSHGYLTSTDSPSWEINFGAFEEGRFSIVGDDELKYSSRDERHESWVLA